MSSFRWSATNYAHPLTSIHGALGMLASGLLNAEPETGKRLLEIAVDSTERLMAINDILISSASSPVRSPW